MAYAGIKYEKMSKDEEILNQLKSIPGYPFDFKKDLSFIKDLLIDFPTLDLIEEIKKWKVWLLDSNLDKRKKRNYRSRFRNWLKNSIKYEKIEKPNLVVWRPLTTRSVTGFHGFDFSIVKQNIYEIKRWVDAVYKEHTEPIEPGHFKWLEEFLATAKFQRRTLPRNIDIDYYLNLWQREKEKPEVKKLIGRLNNGI